MSNVKVQGNISGTGTLTIAAPNTNTDRTLTLPDEAGTVLTSASTLGVAQLPTQLSVNASAASGSLGIDSAGRVTMPYQPAVSAKKSSTHGANGAGLTLVYWDAVDVNTGGHYSASTGLFTCPVGGVYQISAHGINAVSTTDGIFAYNQARVHKNGLLYGGPTYGYGDGYSSIAGTWLVPCSAGDSLAIHASSFYPNLNGMTIRLIG